MRNTLQRIKQFAAAATITATVAVGTLVGTATPAAAVNTYVWNDVRGEVLMFYVPNEQTNVKERIPNGTRFQMSCWIDNQGFRWFGGTEFRHGVWGYVRANWVYNQTGVGHC